MTEYKELAARAEKMRAEMIAEGVNGWPNTVAMLIDGLAALEAEVANLAHDISVYIGANSELLANVDEARANRDSHQRVAIAAEARCKRLEEALSGLLRANAEKIGRRAILHEHPMKHWETRAAIGLACVAVLLVAAGMGWI